MSIVKFTEDHEWVQVDGGEAVVGITDFAQQALGDIVYVELPAVGRRVEQGQEVAVVESVKAASEVYAPLSGEIIAVNDALTNEPALVNSQAQGDGWFFKLRLSDAKELDKLMTDIEYKSHTGDKA